MKNTAPTDQNTTALLDALTAKGVLISVNVRYWRARKKLNPEDLGLSSEQVNERLISLGHKRLLPKECLHALSLIESRAHAFVQENSFTFLNGVARYLPNNRLNEVTAKLDELKQEFKEEQAKFMNEYGRLRAEAIEEWRNTASNLTSNPDLLVNKVENAFPPVEKMDRYFSFDVHLFQVTVPDMPQADLIEAGTVQEITRAREQACREAKQRIRESCESFIQESTREMRSQTAQLCSEMLDTINGKGYVHQKTLNRLVRFIDHFKQLNFMQDEEMEEQLERTRQQFLTRTAEEYRDDAQAREELVNGLNNLRQQATALAEQDAEELVQGFGEMGKRRFNLAA